MKLLDAQSALGFLIPQTSYIERTVNEIQYPDIQYPSLIPVDTSASPWAKTVTYYSADKFGRADWINGNSDDVPLAGTDRARSEVMIHTAGVGYGYGLEELSQAQMLGINLPDQDARAARRAYEEMVDRVALYGSTEKNFYGLVNAPTVVAGTASTGDWETATPAQILNDINTALIGQYAGTQYSAMADTILLPYEKYLAIASRMVSEQSSVSILAWLLQNNAFTTSTGRPLTVRGIRGLGTAGAGGSARMVAYRYDETVLKLHIPMPHRFLTPYQSGPLRWDIPGVFRLGGLDIRRPLEMSYTDGI